MFLIKNKCAIQLRPLKQTSVTTTVLYTKENVVVIVAENVAVVVEHFNPLGNEGIRRMNCLNYLSVRDVSLRLEKSEETIKRWIRKGKLPAVKNSDREGWMILESDLEQVSRKNPHPSVALSVLPEQQDDEKELISLAFQGVTLLYPTEDILDTLSDVGLKRTLEVLLVMRQSPKPIKNPLGFIRKAIQEEWIPETAPVPIVKKQAFRRNKPIRKERVPDWVHSGQEQFSEEANDPTFEEDKKRLEESLKNRRSDGVL